MAKPLIIILLLLGYSDFIGFKNKRLTIIPIKVNDPINAAINIVSAVDVKGSPTTATNIEYTRIINPIKTNSPKIIDLIPNDDPFSLPSLFVSSTNSDIILDILSLIDSLFLPWISDSLVSLSSGLIFSEVVGWSIVLVVDVSLSISLL